MAQKAKQPPEPQPIVIGDIDVVAETITISINRDNDWIVLSQPENLRPFDDPSTVTLDQLTARELHEFLGDMLERWEVDRAVKRQELVRTW